jgi:uncharacterized protein involved in exopolysaccharide biosynthesis
MADFPQNSEQPADEVDLIDYINVIFKRRRMILRNTFVAGLLMLLLSFILPKTYTATTTIMPPDEGESPGLKGLLANAPISLLNLPGASASSSDIFVEILKSRSVAERVLAKKYFFKDGRNDLFEILGEETKEGAVRQLYERAMISANEQGIIQVSVEMGREQLAADVANAFTAALDSVNQEKSISKAKNSRLYIEQQLELTQESLQDASKSLAEFQAQYKAVDLQEQTKVAIEKAGEIKGTIMAKEVELEVASQTLKRDNPVISRLQKELDELKKQFEHLQFGNSVPFENQKDYFIPFADVPEVGLKLAELLREVKVQETVWQLLNQQYYSAKIQEARDTPTVQVLDVAVPPEKRTKPKRKLLVIVATMLTFLFSMFWAFVLEYGERIKQNQEEYQKASNIIKEVKSDFDQFKGLLSKYLKTFRK